MQPFSEIQKLGIRLEFSFAADGHRRHGDVKGYHPSGQLALTGSYVYGQPNGMWRRWYEDGQPASVHHYLLGALHGAYEQYFDNGEKAREGVFHKGKPDGEHRAFFKGNQVKSLVRFRKGKVLDVRLVRGSVEKLLADSGITIVNGNAQRFTRVCALRDSGELVCKTSGQIFEDLSTLTDPEFIAELFDLLDGLYDDFDLPDNEAILVGCGDSVLTVGADTSGAPATVDSAAGSGHERAPMTQQEVDEIRSRCRSASWAGMGLDDGVPDFDADRTDYVSDALARIDEEVAGCRENAAEGLALGPVLMAVAGCFASPACAFVVTTSVGLAGTAAGWAMNSILDDGFGPALDPDANPQIQTHVNDPAVKRLTYDQGVTVLTRPTVFGERGTKLVETTYPNGLTVTNHYDENGELVLKIRTNADGVEIGRDHYENGDVVPDNEEPPPSGSDPPTSGGTSGSSGVDQPEEPGLSRCESLANWWEAKKAYCEQSNWETYDCQQILRVAHKCVDSALINPTPEGDATCLHRVEKSREEWAAEECKRRSGIMLPSGFGGELCRVVDLDATLPAMDICADPTAMCLPAELLSENDLPGELPLPGDGPVGVRPSSARRTFGGTALAATLEAAGEPAGLDRLSDADFVQRLAEATEPMLVVFGARSCEPCKRVIQDLLSIELDLPSSVRVCYLEVPQNPRTALSFGIRHTPTIMLFAGGEAIGQRRVGAATRDMLLKWVTRSLRAVPAG